MLFLKKCTGSQELSSVDSTFFLPRKGKYSLDAKCSGQKPPSPQRNGLRDILLKTPSSDTRTEKNDFTICNMSMSPC